MLQAAIRELRRQPLLAGTRQAWNAMGVRQARRSSRPTTRPRSRACGAREVGVRLPFVRAPTSGTTWRQVRPGEMLKTTA
ncbi:hypothetical protein QJS66_22325 [Kocuria rhizophila]|nr:hypothetical protein QJS66_22325 [Kocuria rhizophila]